MSEPSVLHTLCRKRGEIAGEIKQMQRALRDKKAVLASVDQTIRQFVPGFNTRAIKAIRPRRPNSRFGPGEIARIVRDYLRVHCEPTGAAAIADATLAAKELPPEMQKTVTMLVVTSLRAMAKRGAVTKSGVGRDTAWSLAVESDDCCTTS
jgi:hypothetical protein